MVKLMQKANIPLKGDSAFFPWEMIEYLQKNKVIQSAAKEIKGAKSYSSIEEIYKIKNFPEISLK